MAITDLSGSGGNDMYYVQSTHYSVTERGKTDTNRNHNPLLQEGKKLTLSLTIIGMGKTNLVTVQNCAHQSQVRVIHRTC